MLPPLETLTTFTLLGIRFWDAILDKQITDGLSVTAWPLDQPNRLTTATPTRSSIYAFHHLPGMRRWEQATGAEALAASPGDRTRFVITITDSQQRYFPTVFTVDLPLPYLGIFPTAVPTSPPAPAHPGFYLFSAPTRPTAPGLAVLRAQLVQANSPQPAAFAVLEAELLGQTWYGFSDARGIATLLFPYPPFTSTPGTSPPGGPPLSEQQWTVTLRARYEPTAQTVLSGTSLPTLNSLFAQTAATLWPTTSGTAVPQLTFTLIYGQELVLHTSPLSTLWVSPGP